MEILDIEDFDEDVRLVNPLKQHHCLTKEDFYETRGIGTRGKKTKICEHCNGTIQAGRPHDMHHFYPEFEAYATHKKCSKAFLESLL